MSAVLKLQITGATGLVIDDDDITRTLVVRLMNAMGFERVWSAADGAEGLKLAVENKPTIITTDLEMLPVDGLMFLAALRASRDNGIATIPVLVFTGHQDRDLARRLKDVGADGFVVKPFNAANFSEKIGEITVRRMIKLNPATQAG